MPFSAPSGTHSFTFCKEFCDWKFSSRLLQGLLWCWDVAGAEMMQDVRECGE